jgi:Domain of unknown function (DUF4160)
MRRRTGTQFSLFVVAGLVPAIHVFGRSRGMDVDARVKPAHDGTGAGGQLMPTIAWFYGIMIQMFYNDHEPPHFHARYGRAKAIVRLSDGEIIAGELPLTATRLVRQWALARNTELQDNWQRARAHQPLEKIAGPDADE